MALPGIDDLASVGGAINDYRPVPDPTVERTAAQDNIIAANAVSATRTLTRAFASFTCGASPVLAQHDAVWGTGSGVAPVLTHPSTGVFVLTWPASVNDALGVSHPVNVRRAWMGLEGTTWGVYVVERTAPNEVKVRLWSAGAGPVVADDFTSATTINVFVV